MFAIYLLSGKPVEMCSTVLMNDLAVIYHIKKQSRNNMFVLFSCLIRLKVFHRVISDKIKSLLINTRCSTNDYTYNDKIFQSRES